MSIKHHRPEMGALYNTKLDLWLNWQQLRDYDIAYFWGDNGHIDVRPINEFAIFLKNYMVFSSIITYEDIDAGYIHVVYVEIPDLPIYNKLTIDFSNSVRLTRAMIDGSSA